jgi:hypothetical protein
VVETTTEVDKPKDDDHDEKEILLQLEHHFIPCEKF